MMMMMISWKSLIRKIYILIKKHAFLQANHACSSSLFRQVVGPKYTRNTSMASWRSKTFSIVTTTLRSNFVLPICCYWVFPELPILATFSLTHTKHIYPCWSARKLLMNRWKHGFATNVYLVRGNIGQNLKKNGHEPKIKFRNQLRVYIESIDTLHYLYKKITYN